MVAFLGDGTLGQDVVYESFNLAAVGCDVVIGEDCLINTGAIVSHDCRIGHHVRISPGAILAGNVTIGENTLIGMGTTIYMGVKIGADVIIANGQNIFRDVPAGSVIKREYLFMKQMEQIRIIIWSQRTRCVAMSVRKRLTVKRYAVFLFGRVIMQL